ncbi:MAG TPA: SpoIVB peptidase S55 [Acidobacteriaceae bacterium]|nr:SpoIVB peptidase S55 [Acidobacteriaceae bacterium]
MPAFRFDVCVVPLLLTILAPAALPAQTTPAPQAPQPVPTEVRTPPPPATPPDSATAGIFPLDQVHRGLHGVAYTVFEGVSPSAVEVEILGVLHNALGPGQDMIVARLGGKDAIYTGVVAGMSGSPVYIDGKLAGALAFRIGQFSKEPIAGITPIQQMLEVKNMPQGDSAPIDAGNAEIRPIETPLLFSGFNQKAVDAFKDRFTAQGLTPVVGLGGGSSTEKQPEPIEPGSSVSALLVRGDMEIAATCTATYVDKNQLLACGHPITQTGSVSVPMTKAEVVATLPSPLNAFKIVNTTEEVGAFTQDRQTAIRGEFGVKAHMVPVTVTFHNNGTMRAVHFDVVDSPELTPLLMLTSIYQSMMQSNTYAAETTYRIRERVQLDGTADVDLTRFAAPTPGIPAALGATLEVGEPLVKLYSNPARRGLLRSVALDVDTIPGEQTVEIESAEREGGAVHAGDTVSLRATLRPWHGALRTVDIPVKLPQTLSDGPIRLVVSDATTVDHMLETPANQLDINQTVLALNGTHSNDRVYVTMLTPDPQARLDGRTLAGLPISMANVLDPLRANRALTLNGESAVAVTSVPMDAVVTGNQVVTIQVE